MGCGLLTRTVNPQQRQAARAAPGLEPTVYPRRARNPGQELQSALDFASLIQAATLIQESG